MSFLFQGNGWSWKHPIRACSPTVTIFSHELRANVERAAKIQKKHLEQLQKIKMEGLSLGKVDQLPPISSLEQINFNCADAKDWWEADFIRFEDQCLQEQAARREMLISNTQPSNSSTDPKASPVSVLQSRSVKGQDNPNSDPQTPPITVTNDTPLVTPPPPQKWYQLPSTIKKVLEIKSPNTKVTTSDSSPYERTTPDDPPITPHPTSSPKKAQFTSNSGSNPRQIKAYFRQRSIPPRPRTTSKASPRASSPRNSKKSRPSTTNHPNSRDLTPTSDQTFLSSLAVTLASKPTSDQTFLSSLAATLTSTSSSKTTTPTNTASTPSLNLSTAIAPIMGSSAEIAFPLNDRPRRPSPILPTSNVLQAEEILNGTYDQVPEEIKDAWGYHRPYKYGTGVGQPQVGEQRRDSLGRWWVYSREYLWLPLERTNRSRKRLG